MESEPRGFISRLFGSRKRGPAAPEQVEIHPPISPEKEDVLRNVTPHLLAVTMLQLAMEGNKSWRQLNSGATSEADAKFPMACECYQLSIFLLTRRFGRRIAGIFEASLNAVMEIDRVPSLFPRFKGAIARSAGGSNQCGWNPRTG